VWSFIYPTHLLRNQSVCVHVLNHCVNFCTNVLSCCYMLFYCFLYLLMTDMCNTFLWLHKNQLHKNSFSCLQKTRVVYF
jgi:hypothetical protein